MFKPWFWMIVMGVAGTAMLANLGGCCGTGCGTCPFSTSCGWHQNDCFACGSCSGCGTCATCNGVVKATGKTTVSTETYGYVAPDTPVRQSYGYVAAEEPTYWTAPRATGPYYNDYGYQRQDYSTWRR